jgi:hypothetical protein
VTKIGGQDVSFQLGAYDALKSPTGIAQWIIRAQITLLFPHRRAAQHMYVEPRIAEI